MATISNVGQHHPDAAEILIMLNPSSTSERIPDEPRIIHSRFGAIEVNPSKGIFFARGLLGIPDRYRFALVNFPSDKMRQFMLMQSLEEDALSFITLPLPSENAVIAAGDIKAACTEMQIAEMNLAVLVIVSVHRSAHEVKLSVNARAPLFIDTERKAGVQYVFNNDRYQIQHMLK